MNSFRNLFISISSFRLLSEKFAMRFVEYQENVPPVPISHKDFVLQ
jgi:hypothetical protein